MIHLVCSMQQRLALARHVLSLWDPFPLPRTCVVLPLQLSAVACGLYVLLGCRCCEVLGVCTSGIPLVWLVVLLRDVFPAWLCNTRAHMFVGAGPPMCRACRFQTDTPFRFLDLVSLQPKFFLKFYVRCV